MFTLVSVIAVLLLILLLYWLYSVFKNKIHFIITGIDSGFSISDLMLLWNVSQLCELENPTSLFFSLPALTKCMSKLTNQAVENGTVEEETNQKLISKLFDYRTKIQNESDEKKGLTSTLSLDKGQKIRIILPGKGVFASEIVNNGSLITISVPRQKDLIPYSAEEWVNKVVSVYLWRKGDARYVFDTTVVSAGLFLGKSSIALKHSNNLLRTQKRKSVRAKCEINGMLFIVREDNNSNAIETKNGYRCILQDVSESGALILIGGKGAENIRIKLQFSIQNMLVVMSGVVRTVEYNKETNQSLLHFECLSIEPGMRNAVLSFVYNMLPDTEKEVIEAINQTDDDLEEIENSINASIPETSIENQILEIQEKKELEQKQEKINESEKNMENVSEFLQEVKTEEDNTGTFTTVAVTN